MPDASSCHGTTAHFLLVPYAAQGHVVPFMKLAYHLATYGTKVTLLTTEFTHRRMDTAPPPLESEVGQELVRIVSVPDGLPQENDREDQTELAQSIQHVMPGHLEELIKKADDAQDSFGKFTCVIADSIFGWALEMAGKMGLKQATFFLSSPGALAMILRVPKLIEAGTIDANDGTVIKDETVYLSQNLPALQTADYIWNCSTPQSFQKLVFQYILVSNQTLKVADWVLCNWFHELDPSAVDLLPNIITVGPLLANGQPIGSFWSEDSTCLSWLDRQSPGSVIYIAFGSSSKFSQRQFDELALGLELAGLPFLWVVRSDITDSVDTEYPAGFNERIGNLGKIVQWAPQEKVLAHPSVASYLTHCGWNSTIEAISMGVPMLCWPYFTDQFYNRTCACYGWKVGLELNPDDNGIVTRYELKRKMDALVSDDGIRENAMKLKELAQKSTSKGGFSANNLEDFIAEMRKI